MGGVTIQIGPHQRRVLAYLVEHGHGSVTVMNRTIGLADHRKLNQALKGLLRRGWVSRSDGWGEIKWRITRKGRGEWRRLLDQNAVVAAQNEFVYRLDRGDDNRPGRGREMNLARKRRLESVSAEPVTIDRGPDGLWAGVHLTLVTSLFGDREGQHHTSQIVLSESNVDDLIFELRHHLSGALTAVNHG